MSLHRDYGVAAGGLRRRLGLSPLGPEQAEAALAEIPLASVPGERVARFLVRFRELAGPAVRHAPKAHCWGSIDVQILAVLRLMEQRGRFPHAVEWHPTIDRDLSHTR